MLYPRLLKKINGQPGPMVVAVVAVLLLVSWLGILPSYSDSAQSLPSANPEQTTAETTEFEIENLSYAQGANHLLEIVGQEDDVTLKVKVLRQGLPVAGREVWFELVSSPDYHLSDSMLSPQKVITDRDGVAVAGFKSRDGEGVYTIQAMLEGNRRLARPAGIRVNALAEGWTATMLIGLVGGLALFLFGMGSIGQNLQKLAGDRLRTILGALTSNRWSGAGLGVLITFLLQSSSASTVMLVGLVSATLLTFTESIGVIIGTKVGTILTVQLISFNISRYAMLIIALGLTVSFGGRSKRTKQLGAVVSGFGFIFYGMGYMSGAMQPLQALPDFTALLLELSSQPLLLILFSTMLTVIIQSSSATLGVALALASQNLLQLEACIPISMGAAVGTCATAIIASTNSARAGKQVAVAHLIYSTLSMLIFLPFIDELVAATVIFSGWLGDQDIVRQVANGYTIYILASGVIFLPLAGVLAKLTLWLVPTRESDKPFGPTYLQQSSIEFPAIAIEEASRETARMAGIMRKQLVGVGKLIDHPSERYAYELACRDDKIDILERSIRPFLAQAGRQEMDNLLASRMRAIIYIGEALENMGDIIANSISHSVEKMAIKGLDFSEEGKAELLKFLEGTIERYDKMTHAGMKVDHTVARQLIRDAEKVEQLARVMRSYHLERLYDGIKDTVETSEAHLTIIDSLLSINRRITDITRIVEEELPDSVGRYASRGTTFSKIEAEEDDDSCAT
jgi:phosphate:Na+ symporter